MVETSVKTDYVVDRRNRFLCSYGHVDRYLGQIFSVHNNNNNIAMTQQQQQVSVQGMVAENAILRGVGQLREGERKRCGNQRRKKKKKKVARVGCGSCCEY